MTTSKIKKRDQFIIVLIIAAMIISFGGTIYLVQQMRTFGGGFFLTGAQAVNQTLTTVTVRGVATDFDLSTATIDFGTLARLLSNQTSNLSAGPAPVKVRNNGSRRLDFSINFTADLFPESDTAIASFAFNCTNSTPTEHACGRDGTVSAFRDAGPFASTTYVATNVSPAPPLDDFFLHVSVSVPDNASGGEKQSTITIITTISVP